MGVVPHPRGLPMDPHPQPLPARGRGARGRWPSRLPTHSGIPAQGSERAGASVQRLHSRRPLSPQGRGQGEGCSPSHSRRAPHSCCPAAAASGLHPSSGLRPPSPLRGEGDAERAGASRSSAASQSAPPLPSGERVRVRGAAPPTRVARRILLPGSGCLGTSPLIRPSATFSPEGRRGRGEGGGLGSSGFTVGAPSPLRGEGTCGVRHAKKTAFFPRGK